MTRIEALQVALDTIQNVNSGNDEDLNCAMDKIVDMINSLQKESRRNKKYKDLHKQIYK